MCVCVCEQIVLIFSFIILLYYSRIIIHYAISCLPFQKKNASIVWQGLAII